MTEQEESREEPEKEPAGDTPPKRFWPWLVAREEEEFVLA